MQVMGHGLATNRALRRLPAMLAALATLSVCPAAASEADGKRIADEGNGAGAAACAACHGPTGMGQPAAGFPRLAGMTESYLSRQLSDFRNGTRDDPVMTPIAKALTPDQRAAVARYYAGLPVTPGPKQ